MSERFQVVKRERLSKRRTNGVRTRVSAFKVLDTGEGRFVMFGFKDEFTKIRAQFIANRMNGAGPVA